MFKIIALACLLVVVSAKPKAAETPAPITLDSLSQSAQKMADDLSKALSDKNNAKKVIDVVNENNQKLADLIQKATDQVKDHLKANEAGIQKQLSSISTSAADAKKKIEEVVGKDQMKKATEIKANLQKDMTKAVDVAKEMMAKAEPEMKKAAQQIMDGLMDVIKKVDTDIKKQLEIKN